MYTVTLNSEWSPKLIALLHLRDRHLVATESLCLTHEQRLAKEQVVVAVDAQIALELCVVDDEYVNDEVEWNTINALEAESSGEVFPGEASVFAGWLQGYAEAREIALAM
jgi:hypothetical protein